jgi:hypothetical protein
VNKKGNPKTLRASQPGNLNALRSGVYSQRARAEREQEIKRALLAAPFAVPLDEFAATEVACLIAIVEAADRDLNERGLVDHLGKPRALLDYRIRLSGRLERWLRQFGATPQARAELAAQLGQSGAMQALLEADVAEGERLLRGSPLGLLPPADASEERAR